MLTYLPVVMARFDANEELPVATPASADDKVVARFTVDTFAGNDLYVINRFEQYPDPRLLEPINVHIAFQHIALGTFGLALKRLSKTAATALSFYVAYGLVPCFINLPTIALWV